MALPTGPGCGQIAPQMDIYLATGNAHKAEEFGRLFALAGMRRIKVRSAKELGGMPFVDESAGTFVGNCRLKAEALLRIVRPKS